MLDQNDPVCQVGAAIAPLVKAHMDLPTSNGQTPRDLSNQPSEPQYGPMPQHLRDQRDQWAAAHPPAPDPTFAGFPLALLHEYAETVKADAQRTNRPLSEAAWASVYVAMACNQIREDHQDAFHCALVQFCSQNAAGPATL